MLFMKGEAARVAAMLGALKANRIFIPVASNAPEKWLTQVIEDSETAHIIADSATQSIAELVATGSVTVMDVEQLARSLEPFVADRTVSPMIGLSSILPVRLAGPRAWLQLSQFGAQLR